MFYVFVCVCVWLCLACNRILYVYLHVALVVRSFACLLLLHLHLRRWRHKRLLDKQLNLITTKQKNEKQNNLEWHKSRVTVFSLYIARSLSLLSWVELRWLERQWTRKRVKEKNLCTNPNVGAAQVIECFEGSNAQRVIVSASLCRLRGRVDRGAARRRRRRRRLSLIALTPREQLSYEMRKI